MTTELNKPKGLIVVCTPMYGGMAHQDYIGSILRINNVLSAHGYIVILNSIANESLITRARNLLVHEALKFEDLTGILFLDADQGVSGEDILSMVESGKDIIGAVTPKKSINWKHVKNAALLNKENLETYSGNFVVEFESSGEEFEISYVEPVEVRHTGTGLLYVSAKVFEDLKPLCETYINSKFSAIAPGEEIVEYFNTSITKEDKDYLSEDYNFCEMWKSMGNSVWIAPWVRTTHAGTYVFNGSFLDSVDLMSKVDQISNLMTD